MNSCPGCRPVLDGLPSYELGEEEYAAKEAGDTWVQHLLAVLGQCLKWLAPMLTLDNHDSLVACVLDKVRCPSSSLGPWACRARAVAWSPRVLPFGGPDPVALGSGGLSMARTRHAGPPCWQASLGSAASCGIRAAVSLAAEGESGLGCAAPCAVP